jgi:hypothetical protein
MERVKSLIEKLQEQINNEALLDDMLTTVKMLNIELLAQKGMGAREDVLPMITVQTPSIYERVASAVAESPKEIPVMEKQIQVLQIDEAAVEAELNEMKKIAEERKKIVHKPVAHLLFDPIDDIPTLAHQPVVADKETREEAKKELHERLAASTTNTNSSLNDKLKHQHVERSETLKDAPIKDLRKGIGVNDRFLFIKELFRGDDVMYERSIKTINGFAILPEAEYWIRRELKLKLAWNDQDAVVKQFDQIIKRRFL